MIPILSHVNPTFSQVGLQIGSYAFNTLIFVPLKKKEKKKRRVQFKSSICFKWVPGIMDPEPSVKVTLSMLNVYNP
jgi:hypothetical protein